jgi:predicted ATPase
MDFSCDTLDSDDPNYHGIQTQHLGRLVPSSGFGKGLTVDDLQKGNKYQNKFNNTTDNENMNCSPAHRVNSMRMYESKIRNSDMSSKFFHQQKEPMAVSILNNALRCQDSNQFDRRKNSWSDTHSRNISPDTVKLTAPSLITGNYPTC